MENTIVNDAANLALAFAALKSGEGRKLRLAANMSQADIAKRVGVTRMEISNYESQSRFPKASHGIRYGRVIRHLLEKQEKRKEVTSDG